MNLLDRVRPIEGWLEEDEAYLLLQSALSACIQSSVPDPIVEVGSYHGKSTVILGSIVKAFFPEVKVFAIDSDDGRLGALDDGYVSVPSASETLKSNLSQFGLCHNVSVIPSYAYKVDWQVPISLLVIDGLHDYPSVSCDFWSFGNWIRNDGYVIFHDYADYFPGVIAFVDELLATGRYKMIKKVRSLIVLQKNWGSGTQIN